MYILGRDSCNADSGGPMVYREFADEPLNQGNLFRAFDNKTIRRISLRFLLINTQLKFS